MSTMHAAIRTKLSSGTNLSLSSAWGTAPTSADIATWGSASLGGALTLDSSATWGAINIEGATAPISITGSPLTLSGNQTINAISGTGLSLASAGKDLTISNGIILENNQN